MDIRDREVAVNRFQRRQYRDPRRHPAETARAQHLSDALRGAGG